MLAGLTWMKPSPRMNWFLTLGLAFVALAVMPVGLISSDFARKWFILCWLVLSMSVYWVLNRVLHGLRGMAGETKRDGMLWLVPLAFGVFLEVVFFFVDNTNALAAAILLWSLLPIAVVQTIRPEIPERVKLSYEESSAVGGILRSLLKYDLRVAVGSDRTSSSGAVKNGRRLSASTFIYYGAFVAEAVALLYAGGLVESLNAVEAAASLLSAYSTLVVMAAIGFGALLAATYNVSAERSGWRIQEGEQQILAMVYAAATLNLAVASLVGIAAPLIDKLGSLPPCK